ncbi:RNA polymerase sigma factor, partial [Azohydromonas lata]
MDASPSTEPGLEALLACRIAAAAPGAAVAEEGPLYRLLAPRARRYGLRHPHAAADLMQHVMALTLEQLRGGALREPERVVSFVLGACRLTVQELLRGHRRREALLQRHGHEIAMADLHEAPRLDHERLTDCLQHLAEKGRSVLLMSFHQERPAAEVGALLGLTAGNVRVIRHRGIARLRECVAGPRFVERLAAQGLRLREYRVPCNGSVNCSAAPQDEVLVGRLQVALQGVRRLDVAADFSFGPSTPRRTKSCSCPRWTACGGCWWSPRARASWATTAFTTAPTQAAEPQAPPGPSHSARAGAQELRDSWPCRCRACRRLAAGAAPRARG